MPLFSEGFLSYFNSGQFCDMTLVVRDKEYKSHRIILVYNSGYFAQKLSEPQYSEQRYVHYVLNDVSDPNNLFPVVLRYVYEGRVTITDENCVPLLALANSLEIEDLKKRIANFLSTKITRKNVLFVLQKALEFNTEDVKKQCLLVLARNFSRIANTDQEISGTGTSGGGSIGLLHVAGAGAGANPAARSHLRSGSYAGERTSMQASSTIIGFGSAGDRSSHSGERLSQSTDRLPHSGHTIIGFAHTSASAANASTGNGFSANASTGNAGVANGTGGHRTHKRGGSNSGSSSGPTPAQPPSSPAHTGSGSSIGFTPASYASSSSTSSGASFGSGASASPSPTASPGTSTSPPNAGVSTWSHGTTHASAGAAHAGASASAGGSTTWSNGTPSAVTGSHQRAGSNGEPAESPFKCLPVGLMLTLLSHVGLAVMSEYLVYKAVCEYIKAKGDELTDDDRTSLFEMVRFPYLNYQQLQDVMKNPAVPQRLLAEALVVRLGNFESPGNMKPVTKISLQKRNTCGLLFEYSSDFDEKGILHWIATQGHMAEWGNPVRYGVKVTASSTEKGVPSDILEIKPSECWTKDVPSSWFAIDLGRNRQLVLTYYTLRHGSNSRQDCLRNWVLQCSDDGLEWETIKRHMNECILNANFATASFPVMCINPHRYFRILQTGHNSTNKNFFSLSGIEFYGDFYEKDEV